jgi:methyl-accepting chemotaxis protein
LRGEGGDRLGNLSQIRLPGGEQDSLRDQSGGGERSEAEDERPAADPGENGYRSRGEKLDGFYRDASIKRKLTSVILCTCALDLSLACMAFEIYERASFRASMISGLLANADSLGQATAASLTFDDKNFAEQMLGTIRSEQYVMAVILYAKSGKAFAEYRRSGLGAEFKTPTWKDEGTKFDQESLMVYRSISLDGAKAGSIAIVSDLSEMQSKMRQYRKISALVLLVSILLTFMISSRLVGLITQPILHLAEVAGRVSARKDYTLRAVLHGRDEVGRLVEAFNQML